MTTVMEKHHSLWLNQQSKVLLTAGR
jgi:hypothetical protein